MEKFTARFTQKLGPLPIWAWAAIGLLAILGYMYFTKTGFFGSGTGGAGSGSPASSNPISDLLGGLGGGALAPTPAADPQTAFGPSITYYDQNGGWTPDRGGTVTDPSQPAAPVSLASLSLFTPGQNYQPNYAAQAGPGPGPAPSPGPINTFVPATVAYIRSVIGSSTPSQNFNPVRGRSSGTQAV